MSELLRQKINEIAPVSEEAFQYFLSLFVPKKLRRRPYLLPQGDQCRYQAFVVKGSLRSYTIDEKGAEHILQFASEGWWMADLASYLTGEPSPFNMDALEEAEVLLLSKASWDAAMEKIPGLERYFRV